MDYDYPCNFSRPVSEQLHGNSTNFSGANPRASSFSTYSNSSFGSSSTYDSSSSSSSSLGQNGGNSSSSSGGHLASPQSPAYVSMGFTANSARDSSKQSALFSTLLSKHPNAKSSVQLESVVPLVPPKHRAAPGIYYDMPKNIPVDPRWQVPSAGQHFNTTETPKFPVAAISTPNLYDRPQLPEKSSAVQTKQSMLSLIGSSSSSSPKPHHHNSTLPVIVGASLKAVPGMSHSMQSVAPPPPLSVNTSAYMSTVLGFKQSSTAKPLPPLPGGSAGRPVSASPASLLKSTPPPPPPTPAKPFSSSTVSTAATTYYDVLPAKNTAVSTAYKAAAAAATDDDTTNYDVLPAKNTAVCAYKTAAAAAVDQVDFVSSAKPAVSAASAQPYKFTSIYSKNYVKEAEADDDDDDDDDEDCDYDYDYVCLESKKKLDDEDAGIRRIIPRDFQTRYEKLALNSSSSGGVDLSHLERQMQAHSLSASSNNSSRLNTNNNSAVKRQLLASYRQYLATAMANFAQWVSLTLEIIERNAQQPSVYINFAKHILLSGQNLLLVAKSLNRHYSQLRSLATFADSFYEYLRMIVLKTKRAAAGAGAGGASGGGNFDRQAVSEMVDSIKGALRFASHLKVELIQ